MDPETQGELQKQLAEFERSRAVLLNTSTQKQQLQLQSTSLNSALEELEKTKEPKAYKAVGPIMVLCEAGKLKEQLKEQKESIDLRIKTLQKQEDSLVAKLNKLKSEIEAKTLPAQNPAAKEAKTTKPENPKPAA